MKPAERTAELAEYRKHLDALTADATPVIQQIATHTKVARKAMDASPVDTLTLSNELVELSILVQRLGDRLARMGHIVRGAKESFTSESVKVRRCGLSGKRVLLPVLPTA